MLFIFTLIVPLLGQTCFSNQAAIQCKNLKCCTQEGYCAVYQSECYYSAEKYSCEYADCDFCCLYNGDTVECGTKEQCLTWLFILLGSWLLLTLIVIFAAINRKRGTATRMIIIAEKAKLASQDSTRKSIVSQIIAPVSFIQQDQYEQKEQQSNDQYGKNQRIDKDDYQLQL